MKQKLYSLFLAALLGMLGMQVGAQELTTTEIDGVTYYEIGNGDDLLAFAELVNGGEYGANAVLTDDINLAGVEWTPIGNADGAYTGIFDGQGHAITDFLYDAVGDCNGLFGFINNATVKNFSISGELTSSFDKNGVVGKANGTSVVSGIHSALTIHVSDCKAHTGGIVGGTDTAGHTLLVEGCEYSGTMTHSGLGDCQGGILGYTYEGGVKNCIFSGTIIGENNKYGGILGYCKFPTFGGVQGCLSIGKIEVDAECTTAAAIIANWNGDLTTKVKNNCYCMQEGSSENVVGIGNKAANCEAPHKVTAEQLASGECCYLLNGDQTEISWYQNIGTDATPVLDPTHAQVYMNGRKHCNGELYEGVIYSNEDTGITQDDHDMVDGVCSYCGFFDEGIVGASMVLNADGFYEISNGAQLKWYANYVNNESTNANAILTADIDLARIITTQYPWAPIGLTEAKAFNGIFDGQGHNITNFNADFNTGNSGLFGATTSAIIKDFYISGTMTAKGGTGIGVVGWPSNSRISNIHSTLSIAVPVSGVHHVGGVVGSARGGNVIDRCSFSGSMTVATGSTDNFAGVIAYLGGDSIANCANYGTITFSDEGCAAGGVAGYLNNTTTYIRNCLNVGTVLCDGSDSPKYGGAIIGRIKKNWSSARVNNNFWLEGSAYGPSKKDDGTSPLAASEEGSTPDVLASGEITWQLNNGKFLDVAWYQDLTEEPYPMLTSNGKIVYQFSNGSYENINNDNIDEIIRNLIAEENDFLDEIDYAYQALIDAYKAEIDSWENIETVEEFFASYRTALELKESINKSVAAYNAYIEACEAAITAIDDNGLEGEWTDFLKAYLEDDIDPNSDYPNGSYSYILETLQLDDDALEEEKAFVDQMLQNAIAGGLTAGTEITRLLTNPTFAEGFEGWTTENDEGIELATGGVANVMHIARGLGNGTFNISQTITDLPEGVYVMSTNAMFRAASGDYNSKFYAGQIFMNNTVNYVMTAGEDVLAESGTGLIEYVEDDAEGFVPNSMTGCSYAFSAGHYQNFCATKVTDGTLTVGVRNLDNGLASQWLPFGNMHIFYLGTEEEADEYLTEVLDGFVARAQTIVDTPWDVDEFTQYPNMSEDLKLDLEDAISAAEDPEDIMALIGTFSNLFNQVHACRKAYIAMLGAATKVADIVGYMEGLLTEDEIDYWFTEADDALTHFIDGDVTTEEAIAIAERLNGCSFMLNPVDGVYQLATALDLMLFSTFVNNGQSNIKAVMVDDIDMSELEHYDPIGNSESCPFTGEFDGQGYAINNFTYTATGDNNGLFGYINNATVKNFRISGELTSDGHNFNGLVGRAEGTSVVSGIYSDMNINVANCSAHSGGIVGGMSTSSKMEIHNCEYAGTLTHSGAGDCQAGICGYTYGGGIFNCVFSGTIIGHNNKYGGILGYCKVPSFKGVQNCLSIGKIIANEECTTAGAIIAKWNGGVTQNVMNNYYCLKEGSTTTITIGGNTTNCETPHAVTEKQLASGEVCYKLNVDQEAINWYQSINYDDYPVLFPDHEQVFFNEEEGFYYNLINGVPVGINEIESTEPKVQMTSIYNLAGQRLEKLQKGINIVNGKKVLVK